MELKNRSFQYGKVALPVRTQCHQLQFMFKVVAICTDICMSLVQTVRSLLLPDFLSAAPIYRQSAAEVGPVLNKTSPCQEIPPTTFWHCSPYSALKLNQYSILFSKNHCFLRQPNASPKFNQHYVNIRNTSCRKYANRYFP